MFATSDAEVIDMQAHDAHTDDHSQAVTIFIDLIVII